MISTTFVRRAAERLAIVRSQDGQALVEYALLLSFVAIACFVAVQLFGNGVANLYSQIEALVP